MVRRWILDPPSRPGEISVYCMPELGGHQALKKH
jgi:hypothetical protein